MYLGILAPARMPREHLLLLLSSRARTRSPFAAHSIRSGFCSMGSRTGLSTHGASVAPSIGISGIRVRCNRLQNHSPRFLSVDWVQTAHVSSSTSRFSREAVPYSVVVLVVTDCVHSAIVAIDAVVATILLDSNEHVIFGTPMCFVII